MGGQIRHNGHPPPSAAGPAHCSWRHAPRRGAPHARAPPDARRLAPCDGPAMGLPCSMGMAVVVGGQGQNGPFGACGAMVMLGPSLAKPGDLG